MALKITSANFDEAVARSTKPVLIDFWATWCGPCRMIAPTIDEIAEEHPEFTVGKVNVDEEGELARRFGIMSIPTLVVVKNGAEVSRLIGVRPKDQIVAELQK